MRAIEVVFYSDGTSWLAQALNVEVATFGDTREEARAAITEALELYFEDADADDLAHVIDVSNPVVETITLMLPGVSP